MTDPNKTLIVALVDRTGSMYDIKDEMESAFNAFIQQQRDAEVDDEVLVTLYQFDSYDSHELVYENRKLAQIPPLRIEPRAGTPLNDAMGFTIVRTGQRLAALPEEKRPGQVYFVVITDGKENLSKEWVSSRVKELVARQTSVYGWEFHFLGVGIDAFAVASDYGIGRMHTNSATRDPNSISASYGATAQSIVTSRVARDTK